MGEFTRLSLFVVLLTVDLTDTILCCSIGLCQESIGGKQGLTDNKLRGIIVGGGEK